MSAAAEAPSKRSGSVVRRFNLFLLLLYLVTIAASVPVVYYFTRQQVSQQAAREMTLLVDMVKAVQQYVIKDLRPYFLAKEIFYPPALSGIAAAHNPTLTTSTHMSTETLETTRTCRGAAREACI